MIKINPNAEPKEKKIIVRGITVYFHEEIDGEKGKSMIKDYYLVDTVITPEQRLYFNLDYEYLLKNE